jgi:hypothetical protein
VWQPGNSGALKHGAFSQQALNEPATRAAMAQKREILIADLAAELWNDLIDDYLIVDAVIDRLHKNVTEHGVLTTKGRRRAAIALLLELQDRRLRLADLLNKRSESIDPHVDRAPASSTFGALKHVVEHGLPKDRAHE